MSNTYTDGPEPPDTSKEAIKPYTPSPNTDQPTNDTAATGTNRTEYTDGPESPQDEV